MLCQIYVLVYVHKCITLYILFEIIPSLNEKKFKVTIVYQGIKVKELNL